VEIDAVPFAAAIAVALAWIPVGLRFVRSWRARGNPISLAICVLIVQALYAPIYLVTTFPASWPIATVIAINGISCATFYVAIHYASRKFPDTRNGA
jgi:uncharacterized membrane protein HdeD (DUF308 family)